MAMNAIDVLDFFAPTEQYEMQDWQEKDIIEMQPRAGTADWSEMGCYKTTTALWLVAERNIRNVLIITSKNGKGTYFDAFPKSLTGWDVFNVNLRKTTRFIDTHVQPEVDLAELLKDTKLGMHNKRHAFLIHYDLFQERYEEQITDVFSNMVWDMVMCDEAHRMKNRKTKHVVNIKKIPAKYRHAMTGTGFVNNPAEIWSILNYLDKRKYPNYWNFRTRYCVEVVDQNNYRQIVGLKKHKVAEFRKIREEFGPRHTMDEVHAGIDHPIYHHEEVDLSPTQKRMYKDIKRYLATLDEAGEPLTSPNVISQLNRLRQICVATPEVEATYFNSVTNRRVQEIKLIEPSSKLDKVMELLEEIRWDDEAKHQVVIFSNFKDPLYLLEERFKEQRGKDGRFLRAEIPYLHMQQKHSETERYRLWHDIWPKKEHRVFLSTVALGGESINLTSAKYMIFLDQSWSPKDNMQAVGRVYRPGQENIPEIIYIDAADTVDQYVKLKLDRKQGWFNEIFGKSKT
jgi:SNF2 family DNA or RNA helicase